MLPAREDLPNIYQKLNNLLMDEIYSPITSHHTISQIDTTAGACDLYLLIIIFGFISCWIIFILYFAVFGKVKKGLYKSWTDSLPIGFGLAIIGFVYMSNYYSC